MGGMPIQQLNQGIQTLKSELQQDPLASKRVEMHGYEAFLCYFQRIEKYEYVLDKQNEEKRGRAVWNGQIDLDGKALSDMV